MKNQKSSVNSSEMENLNRSGSAGQPCREVKLLQAEGSCSSSYSSRVLKRAEMATPLVEKNSADHSRIPMIHFSHSREINLSK